MRWERIATSPVCCNNAQDYAGDLSSQPGVHVYAAEARGFVTAAASATPDPGGAAGSFGTASAGLYGMSESYLYTSRRCRPTSAAHAGGMLAVTRWLTLPRAMR